MESYLVKVISVNWITHDVLKITTEKPDGYTYLPGQATELAINKGNWVNIKRPFTFTGLPSDDVLEFIIKIYAAHGGFTNRLKDLIPGDELFIHDVWGAISYQGPGIFIAGGAGITPFISIFRYLAAENKLEGNRLIFANKTAKDIILEGELKRLLGDSMVSILSEESAEGHRHGFVSGQLIEELLSGKGDNIYVCGPPLMAEAIVRMASQIKTVPAAIIMEL